MEAGDTDGGGKSHAGGGTNPGGGGGIGGGGTTAPAETLKVHNIALTSKPQGISASVNAAIARYLISSPQSTDSVSVAIVLAGVGKEVVSATANVSVNGNVKSEHKFTLSLNNIKNMYEIEAYQFMLADTAANVIIVTPYSADKVTVK